VLLTRFPSAVPVPDSVENPQGWRLPARWAPAGGGFKTDCWASAAVNDTDQALR
jgi:hypothetical protein